MIPNTGDLLEIDGAASVQFGVRPIRFRVTKVHAWAASDGWLWMDGYELDAHGNAVVKRTVFVRTSGLRRASGTR